MWAASRLCIDARLSVCMAERSCDPGLIITKVAEYTITKCSSPQ